MIDDPNNFLATLSQSSAAIVAIIGGFLVSRLVALSSEREGIKRQLKAANQRLSLHEVDYGPAHAYRLERSKAALVDFIQDDLVKIHLEHKTPDFDELLLKENHIPRGSSFDEILPFAQALSEEVARAVEQVKQVLRSDDVDSIDLDDLRPRGLDVSETNEHLYEDIVAQLRQTLPSPRRGPFDFSAPNFNLGLLTPGWVREVDARRLDESIRDELHLKALVISSKEEVARLQDDLDQFAQPVGVVSAVAILGIFSILGIVLPLIVMVLDFNSIPLWLALSLLGAFTLGLTAVLGYIIWYLRKVRK